MIKQFTLPKSGAIATIRTLDLNDLAHVISLQDATRDALPEAQKMFVLPQSSAYFEQLLSHHNGIMIGVFAGDTLVGQMAVMGPLTLGKAIEQQKLTRNEVHFHHAADTDSIVLAKSMTVHPNWRGNEISQQMLTSMMDLPFVRATDHIFAQISVDNVRSWELFLHQGFGIVAAVIDPQDHKARFIVQKPSLGFALHAEQSADDVDPGADFAAIMRLTQREALVGMLDEGIAFKLAFYAGINSAAAWYDTPANSNMIG